MITVYICSFFIVCVSVISICDRTVDLFDRNLMIVWDMIREGRRHGFESGGDKFCERSEQKILFDPHFLTSGGSKYCLDS